MKYKFLIPLVLLLSVLDVAFFNQMKILDVSFNIGIVFCVVLTVLYSEKEGIICALLFGLYRDIFFSKALGITALSLFIIVVIISLFSEIIQKDNMGVVILITATSTIMFNLTFYVLNLISENRMSFLPFVEISIVSIIYNSIVAVIVHSIFLNTMLRKQGAER